MSLHHCWHEFVLAGDQLFLVLSVCMPWRTPQPCS